MNNKMRIFFVLLGIVLIGGFFYKMNNFEKDNEEKPHKHIDVQVFDIVFSDSRKIKIVLDNGTILEGMAKAYIEINNEKDDVRHIPMILRIKSIEFLE